MISKGLLSEVSGIEIKDVTICGTSVCYNKTSAILGNILNGCGNFEGSINIYELAHKYKEWALKQGFHLNIFNPELNCIEVSINVWYSYLGEWQCIHEVSGEFEPNTLFQAC